MSENNGVINIPEVGGSVLYSGEVIEIISGLAAAEVAGVAGMSGSIKSGIGELLGKKDLSKGIKATIVGDEVTIDLNVIMTYGSIISDVALKVQQSVKRSVETMTGLKAVAVNVFVSGIQLADEEKK